MKLRRTTRGRTTLAALVVTSGLLLTVAGCGGDGQDEGKSDATPSTPAQSTGDDGKGEEESQPPAHDSVLATSKDGDVTVTFSSAQRDSGGFVTVAGEVANDGNSTWLGANWKSDETELAGNGGSMAGASLVDQAGKKKYLVLRDTSGRCLCTKFTPVMPGKSASWYAQFPAPPESIKTVNFQIGGMPPVALELSEGE